MPSLSNQYYSGVMDLDDLEPLQMASLRLPDNEELDFDSLRRATSFLQTVPTTEPTFIKTRHHFKTHYNHSITNKMYRETANNFVDIVSNSILDIVNTNYGPENKLATVHSLGFLNTGKSSLTDFTVTRPTTVFNSSMGNMNNTGFGPEFYYRHNSAMTAVYCVAYLLVFAVGLIGNCFVIAVVFRSPRMRTVTNFFIVNLAVADILVIVFCLPATLMSNIFVREY